MAKFHNNKINIFIFVFVRLAAAFRKGFVARLTTIVQLQFSPTLKHHKREREREREWKSENDENDKRKLSERRHFSQHSHSIFQAMKLNTTYLLFMLADGGKSRLNSFLYEEDKLAGNCHPQPHISTNNFHCCLFI